MGFFRSLLGRRQFLITFTGSTLVLVFNGMAKALYLLFQPGITRTSDNLKASNKKSLKGIVVYYSATGNTAKVANAIYKGMKSVIACDVA